MKYQDIYPVNIEIVRGFLKENSYMATHLTSEYQVFKKGEYNVKIPTDKKVYNREQVVGIFAWTDLEVDDFEKYVLSNINTDLSFINLIKLAVNTKPPKDDEDVK